VSDAVHTAGSAVKLDYTFNCFVERVRIYGAFTALELTRCYEAHVNGCILRSMTPATGIGLLVNGQGNDQYVTDTRVVGKKNAEPLCGVLLARTSCFRANNLSVSFAKTGFLAKPAGGDTVEFLFLTALVTDEGTGDGTVLDGSLGTVRSVHGTDCWSSSNTGTGFYAKNVSGVKMCGLRCYNNLKHGVHFDSGSDYALIAAECAGNGSSNMPNFHGVVVGNVSGARIADCRSGSAVGFGNHQGYGLFLASPFSSRVIVDGNDFTNNITGDKLLQGGYKLGSNYP
jgi:hypothetical protein